MTPAPLSPRSEPLLWLQLLGFAVLPLEALLLLLLLAGSDPGPLAPLERIIGWGIGSLAPALLLWRRPADVWSLLLVRTPPQGRRDLQRRLSSLQGRSALQAVSLAIGCLLSLILLWWADQHAATATPLSPTADSPRLVALLLSAGLLALIQWQWQQASQAAWLLSRDGRSLESTPALQASDLEGERFSPGLSLLLPPPLSWSSSHPARSRSTPPPPAEEPGPVVPSRLAQPPTPDQSQAPAEPQAATAAAEPPAAASNPPGAAADAMAHPPESAPEVEAEPQPLQIDTSDAALPPTPDQSPAQAEPPQPAAVAEPPAPPSDQPAADIDATAHPPQSAPEPGSGMKGSDDSTESATGSDGGIAVAIDPEQAGAGGDSHELDQQIG